ncbi:MAG: hypothetical protein NTX82_05060 [Candidatus Parcubacteria bacterium]|nr:hypothetical protein [Candidatus Parcubacteria bacterium]
MPRLDDMEESKIPGMQGFNFSGIRTENLGATEYTLVTIAVDETGSVCGFENELRNSLIAAVEACKKSPHSDNLLLRVIKFSTCYKNGVEEIHGFKPLAEIDPQAYPNFTPGGCTPLFDACFSSVAAINIYAKKLMDDDFLTNGIVFVITDGCDNDSQSTPAMIKKEINKAVKGETIESLITILVGINVAGCTRELDDFRANAGIDQFIDAGQATKGKLAKLADFVSQSVSSQSQALGTGGPSQKISATI